MSAVDDVVANTPPTAEGVRGWVEYAAQAERNSTYYRGLLDEIGFILGPDAFVADDGTISDEVLRAKLPDLVRRNMQVLRSILARRARDLADKRYGTTALPVSVTIQTSQTNATGTEPPTPPGSIWSKLDTQTSDSC